MATSFAACPQAASALTMLRWSSVGSNFGRPRPRLRFSGMVSQHVGHGPGPCVFVLPFFSSPYGLRPPDYPGARQRGIQVSKEHPFEGFGSGEILKVFNHY